jgi:ABC-type amino acid transport substrate-binding protein
MFRRTALAAGRASLLLLAAFVSIASAFAAGCASAPIIVATDAVFPPFHEVDASGALVGYDIEVARIALERAGARARFVRAENYAALFTGLERGDHDVVAATTGITPERLERYGFTRPYFETCLAVLVRAGPGEPGTPAALAGRRVAASAGTTSARAAHAIARATVVETARAADSLAALRSGAVDAVIVDEFEAVPWARAAEDLEVLADAAATESYGLVMRRGDADLKRRLDAALDAMEADGTLARLRESFGLERPADWPVRPR